MSNAMTVVDNRVLNADINRIDTLNGDREALRKSCPPVFATSPHPRVVRDLNEGNSDYVFFSSLNVVEIAEDCGLMVRSARYTKNRKGEDGYGPHEIDFIQRDQRFEVGRPIVQYTFGNSHNRQTCLEFMGSVLMPWCTNGAAWTVLDMGQARTRHQGIDHAIVYADFRRAIAITDQVTGIIDRMTAITLSPAEQYELANVAKLALYADRADTVETASLLKPMFAREQTAHDGSRSLFMTYATLQTRIIQHGGAKTVERIDGQIKERRTQNRSNILQVKNDNMQLFRLCHDVVNQGNPTFAQSHGLPDYQNRDIIRSSDSGEDTIVSGELVSVN